MENNVGGFKFQLNDLVPKSLRSILKVPCIMGWEKNRGRKRCTFFSVLEDAVFFNVVVLDGL